jgi:hypothetical protein
LLDLIPDSLRTITIVAGLAIFLIFISSLIQKYEQYLAERRGVAQRMVRDVQQIVWALNSVKAGQLPAGVGVWLRKEILARYLSAKALWSGFPGINQLIIRARQEMEAEPEGMTSPSPPNFNSRQDMDHYVAGLAHLTQFVYRPDVGGALNDKQRQQFHSGLEGLEVETVNRFYTQQAISAAEQGNWRRASDQTGNLVRYLMHKRGDSPRCDELYSESKKLAMAIENQELPGR